VAQDRLATFATATATCVGVTQPTPDGDATVTSTERAAPGLGEEAVGQTSRSDFEDRPDATVALIAVASVA
jgi:hypothetical protein